MPSAPPGHRRPGPARLGGSGLRFGRGVDRSGPAAPGGPGRNGTGKSSLATSAAVASRARRRASACAERGTRERAGSGMQVATARAAAAWAARYWASRSSATARRAFHGSLSRSSECSVIRHGTLRGSCSAAKSRRRITRTQNSAAGSRSSPRCPVAFSRATALIQVRPDPPHQPGRRPEFHQGLPRRMLGRLRT